MHEGQAMPAYNRVVLSNCTLALDDVEAYKRSLDGKAIQWGLDTIGPGTVLQLYLKNVHVIYHGGKIISQISQIIFDRCFIDIDYSNLPSPRGKEMTRELLAGDTNETSTVSFVAGE
jgi:hypothetical protein